MYENQEADDEIGEMYEHVVTPKAVIEGAPSIRKYRVLNDKRHILTQDSENNVSLYDVLQVSASLHFISQVNVIVQMRNSNHSRFRSGKLKITVRLISMNW